MVSWWRGRGGDIHQDQFLHAGLTDSLKTDSNWVQMHVVRLFCMIKECYVENVFCVFKIILIKFNGNCFWSVFQRDKNVGGNLMDEGWGFGGLRYLRNPHVKSILQESEATLAFHISKKSKDQTSRSNVFCFLPRLKNMNSYEHLLLPLCNREVNSEAPQFWENDKIEAFGAGRFVWVGWGRIGRLFRLCIIGNRVSSAVGGSSGSRFYCLIFQTAPIKTGRWKVVGPKLGSRLLSSLYFKNTCKGLVMHSLACLCRVLCLGSGMCTRTCIWSPHHFSFCVQRFGSSSFHFNLVAPTNSTESPFLRLGTCRTCWCAFSIPCIVLPVVLW